ncbi:MAG: hypothetical protein O7F12_01765 [Nitrospirae bacterium]|nr:hypothetical protein [Nitrospirota bacterium]
MGILDILYGALRDNHSEEIWPKTVGVLTKLFTREDIDFLMKIDGFFSEHGIGDRGLLGYTLPQYVVGNGGISALLTFAAFIEKEILLGTYHRTKFELRQDLHQQMPVWSYLQVLGNPALPHINRTLDILLRLEEKEVAFWETFESRTVNTLNSEFETELNIRVKLPTHKIQEFQSSIQALANMQAENVRGQKTSDPLTAANHPITASSADHFPKKSPLKNPVNFPTPPGTTWPQVTIKFIAPDKAKVSAGHATKVYTFQEMGFEDRRSKDKPNLLWGLLKRGFANNKEIDWKAPGIDQKTKQKLKTYVKRIRLILQTFFDITDDPFEPYRQFEAYRPKFRVEDASPDE